MNQGFTTDQDGNLTVDIRNPFGLTDDIIIDGDEEHEAAYFIAQLSSSQDSEIL